ncbi:MAG TPA: hypothetical protein HPQ04_05980 [Rhodospirillaceae bacterium]|nr:hypothetical protein [Rhodospirillaceae bacterium]
MTRPSVKALCGLAGLSVLILSPAVHGQTVSEIEVLKQQLEVQRTVIQKLEERVNALAAQQRAEQKPAAPSPPTPPNVGYDEGFFIKDATGDNRLNINGLVQTRFNHFETGGTGGFGAKDQTSNNFDIFLGRLYVSGNIVDPSIRFWMTLHGTTTGNGSGMSLLDVELSKTFSPALTIEVGKYWSAYSFGYYADIGKFMFPDMSAAEWAFSLGRQTGARASGKLGDFTYNLSVSNSIPGSDVPNTENLHGDVAVIGNLQYDILAPYGYLETDPNPAGAKKPQLSLWMSGYHNPVEYSSVFQNDLAGDKTYGATGSLNFRYGYFSFQGSGYYKDNEQRFGVQAHPAFSNHGWLEQAGYYLVPGKVEIAERIDGVVWGRGQIPFSGGTATQWYAGPANFPYHTLTEYTGDLNYYLRGHNAKAMLAYSYLSGKGFNGRIFDANRILFQTQLAF